ncbi:MAG: HAMP domain-containing histidine kinase, partial [Eubacterium sp.]|nr:HAMP domain-containing histidine kinase [Eubacterium sp.]
MFKKTKRRVQIVIMSVFVLIWMITLLIIYFSTASKLQSENREMMQIYADAYDSHGLPLDNFPGSTVSGPGLSLPSSVSGSAMGDTGDFPQPPKGDGFISQREKEDLQEDLGHRYRLSTFYAVIFDKEGQVKEYTNQQTSGLSDQELQDLSKQLLSSSSDYGSHENMVYLITYGNDYTMVTLMDISVLYAAIETLLGHMLIFGGIAIILILILSILLSNWVIGPIREAYEKQKVFISDAGHELKTPISTIDANLALLQRQEGQNQWLDNIKYENDRMSLMVHDLLDLARIEQAETLVQEVDFSHTALAAILPFEAIAFEEGHTLEYDIQDNLTLL